jgi:hypothetical protein
MTGVNLPGLLGLAITLLFVFAPLLLGRKPSPGQPGDPPGDDGGGGPPPPEPPRTPPGGIPLADARPARARLRSHERLSDLLPGPARRAVREPDRSPATTPLSS